MLKIAICDDNPIHLKHTVSVLHRAALDTVPVIRPYTQPDALRFAIADGSFVPDIAILDIEMGEMNGIDLGGKLNRTAPDCQIIYLSSYAEHASTVYQTRHVWFVLKNRIDEFLIPAVQKAMENGSDGKSVETISVRTNGTNLVVPLKDVIYMERVARKVQIICRDGTYLSSQMPSKLLKPLHEQSMVQCHQGFWVNLMHVSALDHNVFVMNNGARIPLSRTYRDAARSRFFDRYRL